MSKILVIGSSNIDLIVNVSAMPRPGETVRSERYSWLPGGKGANQAYACGKLGGDCVFWSAVGADPYGQTLLESLQSVGVNTDGLLCVSSETTGMALITVDAVGENSIVLIAGANAACDRAYLESGVSRLESDMVVLAQLETPLEGVMYVLERAKQIGCRTILNPAPAPENRDALLPIYPLLDYITPNETELERLTGCPTDTLEHIYAAAETLLERGVQAVLVTMGERGAALVQPQHRQHIPAIKVRAVDTTAAGDTFNAAFTVELAAGKSIEAALRFATAAAAVSVTRKGAQPSIPTRKEAEALARLQNAD